MTRITALLLLMAAAGPVLAQSVLHVDADAAGAGDGSSWANAFPSLADALSTATSGDQIWVAAGTYRPDDGVGRSPGDRTASFALKSGVRLHGGFAGTEASLADRSPAGHSTFLSGDLAGDDDGFSLAEDNSYHVVRATDASDETLLEGFVVIGGRADGADADSLGGGLLVEGGSPWIINTRFNSNAAGCGGGIAMTGDASPTIVNAVVNGNRATVGGGICALDSAADIVNATVSNNTALRAPGVYNSASTVDLANSVVAGNMPFDVAGHCEVWQYPCSFFHETEDVQALTQQVLAEAHNMAVTGGMTAALDFLQNHPAVVQAFGNSVTVAARVAGGSMALLVDDQDFASSIPPPQGPSAGFGKAVQGRVDILDRDAAGINPPRALKRGGQPGSRTIVGDDTDGNGVVNNRDQKYALIISPFSTWDAFSVRGILGATYGYGGNVDYTGTPLDPDDFDLSNWMSWADYDYVYVGTWSASTTPINSLSTEFYHPIPFNAVSTGINAADFKELIGDVEFLLVRLGARGIGLILPLGEELDLANVDFADFEVGLGDIFFRDVYGDDLSDVVIHCAFCSTGFGGTLADAQRGLISVSWARSLLDLIDDETNDIDWSVAASAGLEIATQLSFGRALREAINSVRNVEVQINLAAPVGRGREFRITELPQLVYDPDRQGVTSLLTDLTDVTDLVEGTVGDNQDDILNLTTVLRGLSSSAPDQSDLRFFVAGQEVDDVELLSTTEVPGTDQALAIQQYKLGLRFPLQSGSVFELVALRDIPTPGSGESIYSAVVTVDAFSCNSKVTFSGYRNGAFTGAAFFEEGPDGTASLRLTSTEEVLANLYPALLGAEANYGVWMALENRRAEEDPDDPDRNITVYDVLAAGVGSGFFGSPWGSHYNADDPTNPCQVCGGTFKLDSLAADGITTYGSFEFTGEDLNSTRTDPKPTTAEGTFKALPGSLFDTTSPYFLCLEEYWDTAEEIFE